MVIDTSALISILTNEPDAPALAEAIERAPVRRISAASHLEASIVILSKMGEAGVRELDLLLRAAEVQLEPVTADQALLAREAWARFGRGRHPAKLNYGDCFSYALAQDMGEPLLYKGEDFIQTDVAGAIAREP
jgi:ribonuclease VapC